MVILQHFVAIGTQVKLEFPGKASAMAVCDTVEGPIVELEDGTVTAVHEVERAEALLPFVRRIVDLGEILVGFGEFLENNRSARPRGVLPRVAPRGELRAAGSRPERGAAVANVRRGRRALAHDPGYPLHPRWLLFWHDLAPAEIRALAEFVERLGAVARGGPRAPRSMPLERGRS